MFNGTNNRFLLYAAFLLSMSSGANALDNIRLSGTVYGVCETDTVRAAFPTLKVVGEQSLDTLAIFYGDPLGNWSDSMSVGIDDLQQTIPDKLRLYNNYPNPFNPSTTIRYELPMDTYVSIILYNILGQEVRNLFSGHKTAGYHMIEWDGKNNAEIVASAGVYIYILKAGNEYMAKKLMKLDGGRSSGIAFPTASSSASPGPGVLERAGVTASADSSFTFVVSADTIETLVENEIKLYDGIVLDFYAPLKNRAPSVENVIITPENPVFGDTLRLLYDFIDPDKDADQSVREWYRNNKLTGVTGLIFPPDSTQANDSIKAIVTPYDGELYGNSKESNVVVVEKANRTSSGIITEFFSGSVEDSALVKTSIDSAYTDENGAYTILASTGREDVLVLKPNRFESGFILKPGELDTLVNHNIAKDDSVGGISRWLFENYILGRAGRPTLPEGVYVSLTEESVPDTVWILGHIVSDGGYTASVGFQNVAQINKLGEKINVTADSVTKGLYNIDSTAIVIADSNFTHPDSVALFAYQNMVAVSNEEFPVNDSERMKKTLYIRASNIILGGNGTFYEDDDLTIKGHTLILQKTLTPGELGFTFDTEFCSSILGGVETPSGYPSVLAPAGGPITEHDLRIFHFVIDRGPGRIYPDFPKGFNPELIQKYAP